MGFLRRVLSAAVAELQRQGAVKERERLRLEAEAEAYSKSLAMTINAQFSDPVAIGRSIDNALKEYRNQTGRKTGPKDLN